MFPTDFSSETTATAWQLHLWQKQTKNNLMMALHFEYGVITNYVHAQVQGLRH